MTPEEESRHIAMAKADLEREFAALEAVQVDTVIDRQYAAFEGARVRDYVPLLVRRAARRRLRELTSAR